jgi:hypothetical protein
VVKDWLCHLRPFGHEYEQEHDFRFTEFEYDEIHSDALSQWKRPVLALPRTDPYLPNGESSCLGEQSIEVP